jgi:signal transduction histidine kinase
MKPAGAEFEARKAASDEEIRRERAAAVFAQIPLAVTVTLLNAALLAAVVDTGRNGRDEALWLAGIGIVAAARMLLWRAHRSRRAGLAPAGIWGLASAASAGAAGLVWGAGAAWLWPPGETDQLFWVFVIGGMCMGAAALHYAHLPTAVAFVLPAGLPVAACFALAGTERGLAAAAMILVFLAALVVSCRRSSALFGHYLHLQLEFARQAERLDAANASLREEIAQRRATEASLQQAQKMEVVGQLTGGMAHDFSNLLTAMLGSLALLEKRLPADDEPSRRLLDGAMHGARRGAALTRRLLTFGREQAFSPVTADLPAVVRGTADLLQGCIGTRIEVELRLPEDLPPIQVDANQLELALLNLALNARDAMPAGGRISISAEVRTGTAAEGDTPGRRFVVLTVADTGHGMDGATLARAAEPFFTTKSVGRGTGLGLAMVQGLASQAGGRLVLHSRLGHGTVAELWLPSGGSTPPGLGAAPGRGGRSPARDDGSERTAASLPEGGDRPNRQAAGRERR